MNQNVHSRVVVIVFFVVDYKSSGLYEISKTFGRPRLGYTTIKY